MSHTVVLTDIPAEDVDRVMADFRAEGASPSKTPQPDGKYTVTAVFSDAGAALKTLSSKQGVIHHAVLTWKSKKK